MAGSSRPSLLDNARDKYHKLMFWFNPLKRLQNASKVVVCMHNFINFIDSRKCKGKQCGPRSDSSRTGSALFDQDVSKAFQQTTKADLLLVCELGLESGVRHSIPNLGFTSKNGITKHVWYSTLTPMSSTEC